MSDICDREADTVLGDILATWGCGLVSVADATVGRAASAFEDVSENVASPANLAGLAFGGTVGVVAVAAAVGVTADLVLTKGAGLRAAAAWAGLR